MVNKQTNLKGVFTHFLNKTNKDYKAKIKDKKMSIELFTHLFILLMFLLILFGRL